MRTTIQVPERLHRVGALVAGLVLGPLLVQGAYRLEFLPLDGYAFFLPMVVLLGVALFAWTKGQRWFASGLAVGAVVWTALVLWVVVEYARGLGSFPD